ncbi:MAG: DUF1549 domain-containing protein [Rubripirellula sp.]|nr:DUF1549 domain-containing protein [Rubripirellula sp.]
MELGKITVLFLLTTQLVVNELGAEAPNLTAKASPSVLHLKIDRVVAATSLPELRRNQCDEYEFVRRVYLDLVGRSPNTEEVSSFVNRTSENRRSELIDNLLESPEFVDHFASVLDIMLMERRAGKRIAQTDWLAFLKKALHEKWPFDQIVQTVVAADGRGDNRAAAKFVLDRDVEPNALTRDIARIFLGRDLQCAQCHDHPNITDYYQSEYYELHAFLTRSYLFEDPADKKTPYVGEKAEGESEYQSVFTEDPTARAIPGLPGDRTLDAEPRYDGESAYVVEPSKDAAGLPKFSRRVELARILTSPTNDLFARNVANRLWGLMMGRGLVHPVDFDHSDNPPANPQLLEVLTEGLREQQFGIRAFLGQVARSKVYQSSVDAPNQIPSDQAKLKNAITRAEQQLQQAKDDNKSTKAFLKPFEQALGDRRDQLANLDSEITARSAERDELLKQVQALEKNADALNKTLTGSEEKLAAETKKQQDESQDVSPELAKLKSAVEDAKQAVQENVSAVAANKGSSAELLGNLAALKSRRIGVADSVAEARGALLAARRLKSTDQPAAHHQQHLAYLNAANKVAESKRDLEQIADQLTQNRQTLKNQVQSRDQLQATMAEMKEREAALEKLHTQSLETLATKRKESTDRQQAIEELAVALKRSQQLAQALADAPLLELIQSTSNRQEKLQTEMAQFDAQIEQLQNVSEKANRVFETAKAARANTEQAVLTAVKSVHQQEAELAKLQDRHQTAAVESQLIGDEWIEMQERRLVMRQLKPLSPEQMAGTTISALRLDTLYRASAESDWKKSNKDVALNPEDPKQQSQLEGFFDKRVGQVRDTFVSLYAAPAGAPQDVFSATADQALFLANDSRVQSWLTPAQGTLVKQLIDMESVDQIAQNMFLGILCRPPTDDEVNASKNHLATRNDDRTKAIQEMVWGLISSAEFRFNH